MSSFGVIRALLGRLAGKANVSVDTLETKLSGPSWIELILRSLVFWIRPERVVNGAAWDPVGAWIMDRSWLAGRSRQDHCVQSVAVILTFDCQFRSVD
jgi:hypothetical protein